MIGIFVNGMGLLMAALAAAAQDVPGPLETPLPFARHEERGAQVEEAGGPGSLRITFNDTQAVVRLKPAAGAWNLEQVAAVLVDVTNRGPELAALFGRIDGRPWIDSVVVVAPGVTETLWINLKRDRPPSGFSERFPAMKGYPGGVLWLWDTPDPAKVRELSFQCGGDLPARSIVLANLRTRSWQSPVGKATGPLDDAIFPFVDRYGQYMHREWPGKIHGDADLAQARQAEGADLRAHPGPADWCAYGGWTRGPACKATGHFRTEKVDGRWWLVDPDGHLFWSHGITCVRVGQETGTRGRERCFAALPGEAVASGTWNIMDAAIRLKYPGGRDEARDLAHVRLRSWGMNTCGNWSDENVFLKQPHRTPYVLAVHYGGPKKDGFPVVADPGFRTAVHAALAGWAGKGVGRDPYCMGAFIDNELHPWSDDAVVAETYFRTCREEMRALLPEILYLGCRFDFHYFPGAGPQVPVRMAAKYCDVVSFNRYRFTADELRLPDGADDKPIIIGEFHFGALDRGLLHTGLRSVASQAQRGEVYRMYLRTALHNPAVVGAHWFQYGDQAVTGRGDGENYQIGFTDICDTPYAEAVAASRDIGESLYRMRSAKD